MSLKELTEHIRKSKMHLYTSIKEIEYLPQPILGVEIPKGDGKTRLLSNRQTVTTSGITNTDVKL